MRLLLLAILLAACTPSAEPPGPDASAVIDYSDYCDDKDLLDQVIDETLLCGVCISINCGDHFHHHCTPGQFPGCVSDAGPSAVEN